MSLATWGLDVLAEAMQCLVAHRVDTECFGGKSIFKFQHRAHHAEANPEDAQIKAADPETGRKTTCINISALGSIDNPGSPCRSSPRTGQIRGSVERSSNPIDQELELEQWVLEGIMHRSWDLYTNRSRRGYCSTLG